MRTLGVRRMLLLVVLAAGLASVGCGSTGPSQITYSLVGRWSVAETYTGAPSSYVYVFSGTATSGTATVEDHSYAGPYTVSGANLTITLNNTWRLTGSFVTENRITGDIYYNDAKSGTFVGDRL
jgi:hypothetical protein